MKLAERLLESIKKLNEKLILINKNKKSGQILLLVGGGGSGKGFAASNFLDTSSYKQFNVDELKSRLIKIAKLKGNNPELANLDLKKPEDVAFLHKFVSDRKLDKKQIDLFLDQAGKSNELPNILFDITFKDIKKFNNLKQKLDVAGYKSEDIHIVWILTNFKVASENNKNRDRVVPKEIILNTHIGAATTVNNLIIRGEPIEGMNGEVYIVLNNKEETVPFVDSDGNKISLFVPRKTAIQKGLPVLKGKSGITKIPVEDIARIKSFSFMRLKDSKKALPSPNKLNSKVINWIMDNIPKEARDLITK